MKLKIKIRSNGFELKCLPWSPMMIEKVIIKTASINIADKGAAISNPLNSYHWVFL
ncbi:hypothetical protein [Pseudomonas atacamensis]|uniref:hypothetical protein n=1 Tax=Pseudomonas atacamensis TaxID=2565368 RepID=UPI00244A248A|nr:hypothetical protein [Pseudomonas atacamensis]MDH2080993.1 hypothetical protein [Pseudomonas atacamensis]